MAKVIAIPKLHQLQQEISDSTQRFRVLACGRRWGKSMFAMLEAFFMQMRGYYEKNKKQRIWIIAPTFPLVREDWLIAEDVLRDAIIDKKLTEMKLITNFGAIEFKSAEREDEGLRGAGLDGAVIDEASRVTRKSWEQGIRPALADKQGRAIFISTPKGRNWFYELYMQGQGNDKLIKSWKYPSYTNPYFPNSEWKIIQKTTPEMILKQEYYADFLEDEASVFKNVSKCLRGSLEEPIKGEYYTTGIDLGKAEDFTVITTIRNSTCQVVNVCRMREIDWSLQKKQIIAITNKYNGISYIDSTGLGDPIEEDLRKSGVNIKDYKFTNQSKQEIVEQLVVAIEQGLIGIPMCVDTNFLIEEIKAFSYEVLPSGKLKYGAPQGLHDDGVISLGLAVRGIWSLLYDKPRQQEEKKPWGTADDWDRFYAQIDNIQLNNPFLNRESALRIMRDRRVKQLISKR